MNKIIGYKYIIHIKLIESAGTEGVKLLKDFRELIDKYGQVGMFSFT